jgi:hypothetical protein
MTLLQLYCILFHICILLHFVSYLSILVVTFVCIPCIVVVVVCRQDDAEQQQSVDLTAPEFEGDSDDPSEGDRQVDTKEEVCTCVSDVVYVYLYLSFLMYTYTYSVSCLYLFMYPCTYTCPFLCTPILILILFLCTLILILILFLCTLILILVLFYVHVYL